MAYARAARALRARIPEVMAAYRASLLRVNSPLATLPEAWRQCRWQALAILDECVDALALAGSPAPPEETDRSKEYTRLLGSHRALQRIPAAESVRAVEILWSALEPAVRQAMDQEALVQRPEVVTRVNAAFRAAAGSRLHAGMLGYEETRGRLLATGRDTAGEQPDPLPEFGPDAQVASLTVREREVLEEVARAMTNRQIARRLGITEPTVKRHLSNVFAKLGASSRMDAVHKAFGGGLDR
ncbi:LuxR C-terminal-related transcriptional regulator [Streptomyces sp. NPDC047072]|uniref:helix-turn-helix transcriptional regulator n=1 Tax=Streptomyces sp. NPDC047072 TaxID=3154809 RepID=UPI0033D05D83